MTIYTQLTEVITDPDLILGQPLLQQRITKLVTENYNAYLYILKITNGYD